VSISTITAATAAGLGDSGTLINSTLHYLDGGRIQLIASTIYDKAGKRQTLIRPFVGAVDLADAAKKMAADWAAGSLDGVVT
jgi:hypothetical protein